MQSSTALHFSISSSIKTSACYLRPFGLRCPRVLVLCDSTCDVSHLARTIATWCSEPEYPWCGQRSAAKIASRENGQMFYETLTE